MERLRVDLGGAGGGAGAATCRRAAPKTRRRGAFFLTALREVVREAVLDLSRNFFVVAAEGCCFLSAFAASRS